MLGVSNGSQKSLQGDDARPVTLNHSKRRPPLWEQARLHPRCD